MPLSEFASPSISQEQLKNLNREDLLELLQHKTRGVLAASKINLSHTPEARLLIEQVKVLQQEIEKRNAS